MKKLFILGFLSAICMFIMLGCASLEKSFLTQDPTTGQYVVKPKTEQVIKEVDDVNALIPQPYGAIGALFSGIASVGLGILAKQKNDKLKVNTVLIKAIEESKDAAIKSLAKDLSIKEGVADKLNAAVKELTK